MSSLSLWMSQQAESKWSDSLAGKEQGHQAMGSRGSSIQLDTDRCDMLCQHPAAAAQPGMEEAKKAAVWEQSSAGAPVAADTSGG